MLRRCLSELRFRTISDRKVGSIVVTSIVHAPVLVRVGNQESPSAFLWDFPSLCLIIMRPAYRERKSAQLLRRLLRLPSLSTVAMLLIAEWSVTTVSSLASVYCLSLERAHTSAPRLHTGLVRSRFWLQWVIALTDHGLVWFLALKTGSDRGLVQVFAKKCK